MAEKWVGIEVGASHVGQELPSCRFPLAWVGVWCPAHVPMAATASLYYLRPVAAQEEEGEEPLKSKNKGKLSAGILQLLDYAVSLKYWLTASYLGYISCFARVFLCDCGQITYFSSSSVKWR